MKHFEHVNANTIGEASELLAKNEKAQVIAGGSDLLGTLKDKILPEQPKMIINLKTIEGMNQIVEDDNGLKLGAMVRLKNIADSPVIKEKYKSLAQAAYSVATPLIRNQATIGGNICQDIRCWYYRYPHQLGKRILCARKGGKSCNAIIGENRYHSIFGGIKVNMTPCTRSCPANTDISAYMSKLRAGDVIGAGKIILENNPIPAVTSRVCAHFCQNGCNRRSYDEGVGIGNIEQYVGDYILEHTDEFMVAPKKESGKSVAIVGAGPAGLSVAYYLRKEGHKVTVFDKMEEAGGLLIYGIPTDKLPKEHVRKLIKALEDMGIIFKIKTEIDKDIKMKEIIKSFDSIFLAIGRQKEISFLDEEFVLEENQNMIKVEKETQMTSLPGIFAGGDVTTGPATVIKAVASGKKAAVNINEYLEEKVKSGRRKVAKAELLEFNKSCLKNSCSLNTNVSSKKELGISVEDSFRLNFDEVQKEANRCFNCGCVGVNPSDISPVLISLNATIITNKQAYNAEEFFTSTAKIKDLLEQDEFVKEIVIPKQPKERKLAYDKFRVRESIDFAVVSLASAYDVENGKIKDAKIVLGAVAPVPIRSTVAEEYLKGKEISEEVAERAATIALQGAIALDKNEYKIQVAKTLVKRSILQVL